MVPKDMISFFSDHFRKKNQNVPQGFKKLTPTLSRVGCPAARAAYSSCILCLVSIIPLPFFRSVATVAVAGENENAGNQVLVTRAVALHQKRVACYFRVAVAPCTAVQFRRILFFIAIPSTVRISR